VEGRRTEETIARGARKQWLMAYGRDAALFGRCPKKRLIDLTPKPMHQESFKLQAISLVYKFMCGLQLTC
jgi:hypothetical protein